jgi:hypothetical protein
MKRELKTNLLVFCVLVALGVITRWISEANYVKLPNPAGDATEITDVGLANFTAIGACALFAGFFFRQKAAAFLLPLAIMVISNLCLRKYNNYGQMAIVYVALLLPVAFGMLVRRRPRVWSVAAGALASSVTFYIIPNFAEWAFYDLYPHTASGLIEGYVAAIPFFRNTLASDALFSGLIFGTYWLAVSSGILKARELKTVPIIQPAPELAKRG